MLGTVVAVGLVWQAAAEAGWIDTATVPPPDEILGAVPQLFTDEGLPQRFVTTFLEAFAAAALAVAAGVPLGLLLYRSRVAGAAFEPWVAGLAAAPLVLLYPLFLVLVGRNVLTIVIMGAIAGLPAIALKTREGFDGTRRVLLQAMRSYGFGEQATCWKLLVPAA